MSIEWEIEELACRAMGKTEEETEGIINDSSIYILIDEKYGIDFDTYCAIVKDLIPFTVPVVTGIRETTCQGFVDSDKSRFIVKVEVEKK